MNQFLKLTVLFLVAGCSVPTGQFVETTVTTVQQTTVTVTPSRIERSTAESIYLVCNQYHDVTNYIDSGYVDSYCNEMYIPTSEYRGHHRGREIRVFQEGFYIYFATEVYYQPRNTVTDAERAECSYRYQGNYDRILDCLFNL